MKSRPFILGFLATVLLLCAVNIYSYYRMPAESTMADGFVYFGLPYRVYAYGGFFTHSVILWSGLIANVLIAICVGLAAGLILQRRVAIRVER
jgi:hypothetical protein